MNQKLEIGVSIFEPFAIEQDGVYSGFEIELWEEIAKYLEVEFEYRQYLFHDLIKALHAKKVDVAIAGITKTEEREVSVDLSHDTLESGLQILVSTDRRHADIHEIVESVFSRQMRILVSLLAILVVFSSHLLWFVERGSSVAVKYVPGIFESLWWSLVTLSTVGYGDISPETWLGRIVGVFVIFTGFALFGLIITQLSSSLLVRKLKTTITSHLDLSKKKVATVTKTHSVTILQKLQADIVTTPTFAESVVLLQKGEVMAVVFDAPVVEHYVKEHPDEKISITGDIFDLHHTCFAVADKDPIREEINRALLHLKESGVYDEVYNKWF